MKSLTIIFSSPWFLLFLVPLVILTFVPYFRIPKRFRRTRNRIIPLILHLTVVTLSVLVLSGFSVKYSVPNEKNEIILLVDVSDTENQSEQKRNDFIETVLRQSRYDSYKVGIVTFGFDQKYAVPLTDKIEEVFDAYLSADLPDTGATNVADALLFTKDLFGNPETSKIVLVTDGKETDKDASSVVRAVAASGIKVDVVNVPSSYENNEVEILDVKLPDYHVKVNEEVNIVVTIVSNTEGNLSLSLTDNETDSDGSLSSVDFSKGTQLVTLKHKFGEGGLHELNFKITSGESTLSENDEYTSYFYLEVFNKVLLLGRNKDECTPVKELLEEEKQFEIVYKNIIEDDELVGISVDELRMYDQVILNNIANKDMPEGFSEALYAYVNTYGGGLLTVGGQDENGEAHSYVRKDMVGSVYQQILPVQAIDYTPPIGVVIILDRSGSMGSTDSSGLKTFLECAVEGAKSCLNALSERDFIGIMTLDTNEEVILPLTRRTQESKIVDAIESIQEANGGTVLPGAIQKAGDMLRAEKNISKRHIILVTDGIVSDKEEYESVIKNNYENEAASITLSVVLIGSNEASSEAQDMKTAAELGHGRMYAITETETLERLMREDLKAPDIIEVNMETFYPAVYDVTSPLFNGVDYGNEEGGLKMKASLDGFYGVKLKKGADLILVGDYNVPVYAQWKFGKGSVGSFMCDLSGNWSGDFMSDDGGKRFISNVVENLMPVEDIRPSEINAVFTEQNYTNRLDVYTNLEEGEYIKGRLIKLSENGQPELSLNSLSVGDKKNEFVSAPFGAENNYSRCDFVLKSQGVYKVIIEKCSSNGEILAVKEFYKSFSYSKEYDFTFGNDQNALADKFKIWSEKGNGEVVKDLDDPEEIFNSFVTEFVRIYDPKILFMIIAIVLFLCDIAIRKFKFKWPHEIIKEYREKKHGN
ncbi:MAG: VWA domain-containing protein [Candidatus Borkfalkiaceae bacterium]|nr:VWA domain-containing protein [Christensenellaceae bacterium]